MKKLWFIVILLLWEYSFSQDTCLPKYDLPVQVAHLRGKVDMAYVEEGKGKTIIFIHGLGGNLSHWLKTIHLLSANYKCIAIDLPGYGHSTKSFVTNNDQLQFFADRIIEFIKVKKLKKVTLAGHSMGGQIATILAAQQPKLVSKLVLVAPAGLESFTENESKMLIGATPASVFEKQDENAIRFSFRQNFFGQPADAESLIQDRLRFKTCTDFKLYTEVVSNGVKGMLVHPVKNELKKIKQPVLLIFGEKDALIPNKYLHPSLTKDELIKEAKSLLPQLQINMIGNAGHLVQFEKADEVSRAIKTFLQ